MCRLELYTRNTFNPSYLTPLVGLGRQRYKFQNEDSKLARLASHSSTTHKVSNCHAALISTVPPHALSNTRSRLISALIYNIDPSINIRIQLPWNFGIFFEDIPSRLGQNEALDAASDAIVTAYTHYCAGDIGPNPKVLVKHSRALNALRRCLDDPVKAHSSETLCSIMLLMTMQVRPIKTLRRLITYTVPDLDGRHSHTRHKPFEWRC